MKSLLFVVLLLPLSDARLEFDFSVIYDMQDFRGTPEYPITVCEPGCRVYLTYFMDEQGLGDQYLRDFTVELDDIHNITFYDLNRLQLANGEKGYFDIPEGTKKIIVRNTNGNGATRPLALMVVKKSAPFFDTVEVFDAADKSTIETSAARVVLMSIAPFTVDAVIEGDYSVTVKTSPFDMLSNALCEHVLKSDNTISTKFSLSFNSPVISFHFESKKFSSKLNIDYLFPYERSIDISGYVASPGYIGCENKTFVFRSESYNYGVTSFNETFIVQGDKARHVSLYGDLNTDDWAPVVVYDMDTEEEPLTIIGMQSENTSAWEYELTTSQFSIAWDASLKYFGNESFMVRYEVDAAIPVPPITTVLPKTTPTVPATVPTVIIEPAQSSTVAAQSSTTVITTTTSFSAASSLIISVLSVVTFLLN